MVADYHKVALLAVRNGRILLCRKKSGTQSLILPGGCIETGETHEQCLLRELVEELGSEVSVSELSFIGTYTDTAAGASGKTVQVELYQGELSGNPHPSSEIAELVWFGTEEDRNQLAPSIANKILPDLLHRGIVRRSH